MKESKNGHEKDGEKRKPYLIEHTHGRRQRVRWSKISTSGIWKRRTEEAEALERRRTTLTRRGGDRKTKKRQRKLSLTINGSEGNKRRLVKSSIPMWNNSTKIESMNIEERAH
uniref:Uncharacterized protein n=1 Tax=Cucumis melo TaxID=3656 RepID=A0A9I9E1D0_CUCME